MKVKKILFMNAESVQPYVCTGAGESTHLLLQQLQKVGAECMAVGCMQDYYLRHFKYDKIKNVFEECFTPYKSRNYAAMEMFLDNIQKEIGNFHPDLIITQNPSAIDVLRAANPLHIPVILFVHSFDENYMNKNVLKSVITYKSQFYKIFAVSQYVKKCLDKYHINNQILYPGFCFENYEFNIGKSCKNLFVNPCKEKGINYIVKLAKEFPEEDFVIRESWGITEARISDVLSRFKNIRVLPYTDNKEELFSDIKLLLFPSVCEEAFGRVIVEACYLGVRVIANDVGGVSEALQKGDLIEFPYDIESWKECFYSYLGERDNAINSNNREDIREKFDIIVSTREFLRKSNLFIE